jgi:hypothetical protein
MSHFGPPGGPYSGQPPEPWQDRGRHDPYEQPYPTGGLEPTWAEPEPPPPAPDGPGSRTPILVLAVVLALLVVGGGATALYLLGRSAEPDTAQASPPATNATASQAARPTPGTGSPAAQSTDARFVKVGQCVKNEGAASKPKLVITRCAAKTYQVLARIDGATTGERDAKAKCGKVKGYTDWYFFNSELDVLDFVLCLKLR